jgi:hypothetical protein
MDKAQLIELTWAVILKIGGIAAIASAIATWIAMRFTKPLDSYTEEIARQIARHQNLDQLIEETKRLTKAAEQIRADLSHENWDRQTRFVAKRDVYIKIAEALGELRDNWVQFKGLEQMRLATNPALPAYTLIQKQREEKMVKLNAAVQKFTSASDTAAIMIPDAPYKPVREFKPQRVAFDTRTWEADIERNVVAAQWALYHFQVAARSDLGFEPMVWKPAGVEGGEAPAAQRAD